VKASDWIAAVAALGTWAAVMVALFGDRVTSWLVRRSLEIELVSPKGELTEAVRTWTDESGQQQRRRAKTRYYYVRARNRRRVPAAHGLQIMLMSLEIEGPNQRPQIVGSGPLPLAWKYPELHPLARTVGDDAVANLFFVLEGKPREFVLPLIPNNFPHRHDPPLRLWATVQARAIEGNSPPLRLRIDWNDKWHDGEAEMANNLQIAVA
jgi:hypothetical protein